MRVVIIGASGNVGTSLLEALAGEDGVDSVLGLARRLPRAEFAKTEWRRANIESDDLEAHFDGADAVRPSGVADPALTRPRRATTDECRRQRSCLSGGGGRRRARARLRLLGGRLLAGPKDRRSDEYWPRSGVPTSFYAQHKAEVERLLDRFEEEHPSVRVVRLRPALTFKREAASGIRRLFLGPFLPSPLLRRGLIPTVPDVPGLRFQAVHSLDVGDAYRRAVLKDIRGPFNLAAEPCSTG